MRIVKTVTLLLAGFLLIGNKSYAQTASRVYFSSITPSVSTGQNYTPWLNDDVTNLVANVWGSTNLQYIDVKIKLQAKTNVSKLSLYDFEGTFESYPVSIYAANGSSRTLIGTFLGLDYMNWVDINLPTPVLADSIVVHKYGNSIPQKIKVFGYPATTTALASAIGGTATVCQGASTALTNATAGGAWVSGNAAIATVSTSGAVTGVAAGTAAISYMVGSSLATKVVTVNPAPNAGTVSGASSVCKTMYTTFTHAGSAGTWSSSNPAVASVNSAGLVGGVAAGTANIKYTVTNTCGSAIATKAVTVNAAPSVAVILGAASVCAGSTAVLTNTTPGGTWSSSAPAVASVSGTGTVTGVAGGAAVITYKVTNTCGTAYVVKTITVSPLPIVTGIVGAATVCAGNSTAYTDATLGGTWSSSAPSIASVSATGLVSGIAAGTATISYRVANSCGATTVTKLITVNPGNSAGTLSGTMSVAMGGTTALSSTAAGGTWSSSAPTIASVSTGGVVTGVALGTSKITYRIVNSCGTGSTTATVTVNASAATSVAAITGASSVCAGSTTTLANATAGGAWSSSATSKATVSAAGIVSGISAGTATISYSVGSAVATKVVTVNPASSAGTLAGVMSVSVGGTTALSSTVTGGTWSSSTPAKATVSTAGLVAGVATGTSIVSYVVTNSCGTSTVTAVVSVNAVATPTVAAITGASSVCAGSNTPLANATTGGTWSSSSTATATVNSTGVVSGVSAGTATISYTAAGAVATKIITVNAATSAGTVSGTASVSVGGTTALSASIAGGTWTSSSTAVASVNASGVVTGVGAGTATISYSVSGTCGVAVATRVVTVTATVTGGGTGGSSTSTLVHGKIPVDGKRWYQLNNCSNGLEGLFDGNTSASVATGWGKILANYDAYYPVLPGEYMNIDSIRFYDGAGSNETNPFTVSYIDSNWNRVVIGTYIGTQYNMWVGPNASAPSNYALPVSAHNVRYIVINCSGTYPNEMELYGGYHAPNAIAAAPTKNITLKQEMGVNAFEWDFEHPSSPLVINETRMNAVKAFSGIRHYLDWEKLEPTNGGYTFNPSHSGGWNLDTIYGRCKAEGIEVLVDIKTIPSWMQSSYSSGADAENVPVFSGADFSNPTSYLKQAKVAFQFAARYGSNASVSTSLLSVNPATRWTGDPANTVKRGLNTVKYIECDNERDKWWKGRNAYQTGREYAANMSAFYDGHKNTMGAGVGVKNADPNMQVVMGGVAMPTIDYLKGMIDWCKQYRGYKPDGSVDLCWDVINYHVYPDNGGSMQGGGSSAGTRGAAPEVAHMDTFAARFIRAAHEYAGDMQVWVTETGYDVNPGSVVKAVAIGSKSVLQTQADWVLRNSLLYARAGVDRCFFYMMDDVDLNSTTKFSSCGLVNADYSRKPAADYLLQAKKLMGDYVYKETISSNPIVDRYELGGQSIYVVTKPTENGTTMSYTLPLSGAASVKIYKPTAGQDSMALTTATVSGGGVAVTATETPQFIKPVSGAAARTMTQEPDAPVTSALVAAAAAMGDVVVYPNPTSGNVNISLDNDKQGVVNLVIYNEAGQVYKRTMFSKSAGRHTESLDLSGLPNGMYLVEIGQGSGKVLKKVIKVN